SPLGATRQTTNPMTANGLAFEVASVRQNKSGDLRVTMAHQPGGRFIAKNAPLRDIIKNAYELQDVRLIGAPAWVNRERYDITANAAGNATTSQMRLMLQTLLAERFKLRVHHEMRELPLYELVIARRDGTTGRQLRPTDADCSGKPAPALTLDFPPGPRD